MFWRELLAELRNKLITPEKLAAGLSRFIDIVLLAGVGILVYLLSRFITRRILLAARTRRHAVTYLNVVHSIIGYVIFFVTLVMMLRVLGVDYTAIFAGVGVVGLAVGFGAQTLVRDFISGLFLLLEDLVGVGDYITVGDVKGTVEALGLRVTKVRAFDGTLHVLPNGELTRFGNRNRGHMRAIVELDLAYEQDPEKGMAVARQAAEDWYRENPESVLEAPAVAGLLRLGESGVQIRVSVKVKPGTQWQVEQQLRLKLKQALDSAELEIPFPRQVIYLRSD